MDVRDRKIKKLNALHPLRSPHSSWPELLFTWSGACWGAELREGVCEHNASLLTLTAHKHTPVGRQARRTKSCCTLTRLITTWSLSIKRTSPKVYACNITMICDMSTYTYTTCMLRHAWLHACIHAGTYLYACMHIHTFICTNTPLFKPPIEVHKYWACSCVFICICLCVMQNTVQKYHWFQKAVWMDDKDLYTAEELRYTYTSMSIYVFANLCNLSIYLCPYIRCPGTWLSRTSGAMMTK